MQIAVVPQSQHSEAADDVVTIWGSSLASASSENIESGLQRRVTIDRSTSSKVILSQLSLEGDMHHLASVPTFLSNSCAGQVVKQELSLWW